MKRIKKTKATQEEWLLFLNIVELIVPKRRAQT
jgi:hypothetical protein